MKRILLFALGVLMTLPNFARDIDYTYEGQTLTYTVISEEEKTVRTRAGEELNNGTINKGKYVSGALSIPSIIKDSRNVSYTVIEIGDYAFYDSKLSSVTIPNSVVSIGRYAFGWCPLTSVTIPNSVTSIDDGAFCRCAPLTSVALGNSVKSIGNYTFYNCFVLTSVTIPNSVVSIGEYAFGNCYVLNSVTIGNSVVTIGDFAFTNCSKLLSIIIPNAVTSIGSSAFYKCTHLTSVTIGNSVTSIGSEAFRGCSELTSVTIGNSVSTIDLGAFLGCSSLRTLTIPNSVTSIGDYAFASSNLTTIHVQALIPPTFQDNSFNENTQNTALVTIPSESVTQYGYSVWSDFKNLRAAGHENRTLNASDGSLNYYLIPNVAADDRNLAIVIKGDYSGAITIPERFTVTDVWGNNTRYYVSGIGYQAFKNSKITGVNFNSRIDLKVIGEEAFCGTELISVALPNSVTSIGKKAFADCSNLTSVTIGNSVTSIQEKAFADCSDLTSFTIPNSVTSIGENALAGCSGLTTVTIGNSVTSIGENAFRDCTSLSKADFSSIEHLCSIKFDNNYANPLCLAKNLYINGIEVKDVLIPNTVRSIGDYAFYYGADLTSVTIPNTVTSIGKSAFSGCLHLTKADFSSIEHLCSIKFGNSYANPLNQARNLYINGEEVNDVLIPNSVSLISDYAFIGCDRMASVNISNSVTTIGDYAFNHCTGLLSLTIPNSVTTIGSSAFGGCSGLASVTIPNSVKTIGYAAFAGCSGLTYVSIPGSVNSIGDCAFYNCRNLTSIRFVESDNPIEIGSEVVGDSQITSLYWGRQLKDLNFNKYSICDLSIGNVETSIPDNYFKNITNLRTLHLGSNIAEIGANAFSGCTSLTEIVLPPSVKTIGESAFEGNSNVTSIIMGDNVKAIRDKAFNGCNAENVYIATQIPPTAPNTSFSNYTGKLWLQDPGNNSVLDAYYDAYSCWDRFDSFAMTIPTELKVSSTKISDGILQLTAKLQPQNVSLPQVFWYTTNPKVATVDVNGLVTIYDNTQDCEIIARTLYTNGPTATVSTKSIMVESISLTPAEWSGFKGEQIQLTVTVFPENATDKSVVWTTSNEAVATIDTNGCVTAIGLGTATITAKCGEAAATCVITVVPTPTERLTLSQTTASIIVGESFSLTATVYPAESTDKIVTWSSSNEAVATVDADGKVTAVALGEALITAKCGDVSATCKVLVLPILVETITLTPEKWSCEKGETVQLTATVLPENATDKSLIWTSSDENVASVDNKGLVSIMNEGNCVITAAAADGSEIMAQCRISGLSGIDEIFVLENASVDVYTTSGLLLKKSCSKAQLRQLIPGIYIIANGHEVVKMILK